MQRREDSVSVVDVLCAVLFCAFTFLYLFLFQNDLLAYGQYILAEGTTTYNPLVGAFIITGVLMVINAFTKKALSQNLSFLPSIYQFPSLLILASITDINIVDSGQKNVFGYTWIIAILLLILFFVLNSFVKRMVFKFQQNQSYFVWNIWINLLVMFLMFAFTLSMSNTSEEDHVILRSERLIIDKEYSKAVDIIECCNINNKQLTRLKAFALANTNELGGRFFQEAITMGSDNLLPTDSLKPFFLKEYTIYKALGGIPAKGLKSRNYLEIMNQKGIITPMGKDYLLTACLMDRDIDKFAEYYNAFSDSTKVMPRHYSEAATLYRRLRSNPVMPFTSPEMETDLDDFMALKNKKYPDKTLQKNALRDIYGNTYWYYYYFTSSSAFTQSVSKEN